MCFYFGRNNAIVCEIETNSAKGELLAILLFYNCVEYCLLSSKFIDRNLYESIEIDYRNRQRSRRTWQCQNYPIIMRWSWDLGSYIKHFACIYAKFNTYKFVASVIVWISESCDHEYFKLNEQLLGSMRSWIQIEKQLQKNENVNWSRKCMNSSKILSRNLPRSVFQNIHHALPQSHCHGEGTQKLEINKCTYFTSPVLVLD